MSRGGAVGASVLAASSRADRDLPVTTIMNPQNQGVSSARERIVVQSACYI